MLVEINPRKFNKPPLGPYQMDGIKAAVKNKVFAFFDEMGVGKTYQVINAACILFDAGLIDTVLVIVPAGCKSVWADRELGQILEHAWVPSLVLDYSGRWPELPEPEENRLQWIVTSYEFIRQEGRLFYLYDQLKDRTTLAVCDESSYISNHKAKQTKACMYLQDRTERRIIINGTPGAPIKLYSQFAFLDKEILGFKNFYAFRNHHCVMGGYMNKKIIKYSDIERLQERTKPYVLRRLKEHVLQYLKPKMYTFRDVYLDPKTWALYKQMREEAVVFLKDQVTMAPHAITKLLRLGQLTSGILGGLCDEEGNVAGAETISTEKIDSFVEWVQDRLEAGEKRIIVWCRFRPEMDALAHRLQEVDARVFQVRGVGDGITKKSVEEAKREFQAGDLSQPAILIGQPAAGGLGLTLTTAYTVAYLSNDYNLKNRQQSEDRVHRPGQKHQCVYTDFIAYGPSGQKTIDHAILKALSDGQKIEAWTAAEWRRALEEE